MKKVYIVDDDRNIVESLKLVLTKEGYQVSGQYDEVRVVENLIEFGADCVILDVMFPENPSAGFDIARAIRAHAKTAKLPILMLSAVNSKGPYAATFSNKDIDDSWLPVDEFVEKPVAPRDLVAKLREILVAQPAERTSQTPDART